MPMLCSRSSTKDIWWPGCDNSGSDDEPLSPKVGCMGQVKRSNRVVGFLTPVSASRPAAKHPKVKRMFSSSKVLSSASVSKPATPPSVSTCRVSRRRSQSGASKGITCEEEQEVGAASRVSFVDMDPPLPVPIRAGKDNNVEDGGNLWKRRSGGMGLKRLELQKVHRHQKQVLN